MIKPLLRQKKHEHKGCGRYLLGRPDPALAALILLKNPPD
jgi:hypothetical protein